MNQDNFNEFALIVLREIAKDLRAIRLLLDGEKTEREKADQAARARRQSDRRAVELNGLENFKASDVLGKSAASCSNADECLNAVFGSTEKEEERTLNKFLDIVCGPR